MTVNRDSAIIFRGAKHDPAKYMIQFHKKYRCSMCGQILMDDLVNLIDEQQALITVMKEEIEKMIRHG